MNEGFEQLAKPNREALPLYGCIMGIDLPVDTYNITQGIIFQRDLFEVFSSPMLAFQTASPGSHTPGPWVPIQGGFNFKSHVELKIDSLDAVDGLSPSQIAWLLVALCRLRFEAPIRLFAIANVPLRTLTNYKNPCAEAFEASPHQIGIFRYSRVSSTEEDLAWLANIFPIATQLYRDERFMRALNIFDELIWSNRIETATALIWTSMEILLGISTEKNKTKAMCSALSMHVGRDDQDRDKAYNIIRNLYEKRGRIVHAGGVIDDHDFIQSFALARTAFLNVLNANKLPDWSKRSDEGLAMPL